MALHGMIEINGSPIAGWQATRIDNFELEGDESLYICWLEEYNGYDEVEDVTTATISHRYEDGAAELARKVLQLAEGGWTS